ncbi:hypothetical protein HDV06_006514 [Boothiomyces sp. JEL0866]|nr:hypothetical protein HDV06_006514 [Boothiomyces sp. JEL0866]
MQEYTPVPSPMVKGMDSKRRVRTSNACSYCATKKTKCDGQQPCAKCTVLHLECIYVEKTKRRGPKPAQLELFKQAGSYPERHDFFSWTHASFPPIANQDGVKIPWLQIYFTWVNPKMPMLSQSWFMENVDQVPNVLLHIMYALALTIPINKSVTYNGGDEHYKYCKLVLDNHLESPNPFIVITALLVSFYGVGSTRPVSSPIYLAAAIRMAQHLGMERDEDIIWISHNEKLLGTQIGTSKEFCRLIWWQCYEHDFYTSFYSRLPYMIDENSQHPPYPNGYFEQPYLDSDEQSTILTSFFGLISICRKVGRYEIKMKTNTMINMADERERIDSELVFWYNSLPQWMKTRTEEFSPILTSIEPPPWRLAYMLTLYHFCRIILHKHEFVMSTANPERARNSLSTRICIESASNISNLLQIFMKTNSTFAFVPSFIHLCIFTSGAVYCITAKINGSTNAASNILELHVTALRNIGWHYSLALEKANILMKWITNVDLAVQGI